ncbi:hypothetical protein [Flavobacterium pectinovorum]|uniref:hypothetical protein n=1 Tax=Flavobacterium pectinovorum TaxID=29533 RepID=UPI001FAC32F2|nr:hypothetical protein [Flavobacterium pectinovorum]MCI9844100.1 hypothetical protein [Flavobacterium pectinovorum]
MKKQKIEDIFSSIENFSSVPPPELWNKIEEELDKPKKKKKVILWWSAAACLLLGLLLPTVLHFNSDKEIETIYNGSIEKSVVLDENKNDLNNNATRSVEKNIIKKESDVIENQPLENTINPSNNSQNNNTSRTTITHTSSNNKINSGISNQNRNVGTVNTNQAVAEKTAAAGKQYSFNSFSNNQTSTEKRNGNQALAEKIFGAGKQNSFNSFSNNQISTQERNENQAVAEKSFVTGKQNSFNSFSNNQIPNSIFEDKPTSKNNTAVALNSSNFISDKSNSKNENSNDPIITKTIIAENIQKNNSISTNSLSKQDSVQLAELQNLEKGIAEVKTEKEKEITTASNSEKWSLEVFAGIANSENYNKQKTLGNVNESKQTSTYGVKTNYKLNKKWAVSSGFKINELGQSIANVSYFNNTYAASAPIINDYFSPNSIASEVTPRITNNSGYVFVSKNTRNALKSDNLENGKIDQSLKYIEMPLEVSYSLFNKNKTSISLNTGGFVGKLISNNVTLNGNSIGDNLNASDFVYGTLLSSTLQYRLYKKTHVFVEPGMNYYVNPLNNQTFNQFQWAFNFGLNLSF